MFAIRKVSISLSCCTLSNAFSKSMKQAKTSALTSLARCINTYMLKSASLVPRPLRNANCRSAIPSSNFLYMRAWMTFKNILSEWFMRLMIRCSSHFLVFAFFCNGINLDMYQSFGKVSLSYIRLNNSVIMSS
ncbi:unnamed protein product [Diabrotica balteata]|uniref:Uncharacterized protein n=1 Tax=Diabrotica balteata TaxID=107213 RepID=A0A9N9T4A4_DIABA|nr:unnamed protein product [Diabrotica balteata]